MFWITFQLCYKVNYLRFSEVCFSPDFILSRYCDFVKKKTPSPKNLSIKAKTHLGFSNEMSTVTTPSTRPIRVVNRMRRKGHLKLITRRFKFP